ncbi:protein HOB3, partial [Colletotrichum tofieldiae]
LLVGFPRPALVSDTSAQSKPPRTHFLSFPLTFGRRNGLHTNDTPRTTHRDQHTHAARAHFPTTEFLFYFVSSTRIPRDTRIRPRCRGQVRLTPLGDPSLLGASWARKTSLDWTDGTTAGFKKNVNRATTQVMMKTGHVEKTNDRDYEVEERRFRTMETASLRLQKEAKGYLDSLRAMTASQMRIAETIDAFYGDAGAKDGVSRSYKQAVEDLDAETIKALDGPYQQTVLEPISRFCAYFPDVNECIKKRGHKLLDYDALRAKVKKLVEKPDKDVTKLPRAEKEMEMAKVAYEQLNEQLSTELPQLIDLRVPYLDPTFEALVKIQLRFCAEAYSRMAQVQQYLDADTREQYAQGQLDQRVEQVLQEIRELSISGTV